MSAYDDMREVIEDARVDDECGYSVYSKMFDLIGDAEEENANLRELLSMYVSFARAASPNAIFQSFYPEGPGKRLDEIEMRERALELGVKGCK